MTPQCLYLDLLRKSLVNELYLENEARFLYIFVALASGQPVDEDTLRNIGARRPDLMNSMRSARAVGQPWWKVGVRVANGELKGLNLRNVCEFSHTMIGAARMRNIEQCLDRIRLENIPGDFAETGVWRGGATVFMRGYLAAYDLPGRVVWAADSFEGLPAPTHPEDAGRDYSAAVVPILAIGLDEVRELFARHGLLDDRVRFLKGWFRDTLPTAPIASLALLRLDGDLYESTRDALEALYDKVSPGGFIIVDDYGDFLPCRRAVDEFRLARGITSPLVNIDWSGEYWRKDA